MSILANGHRIGNVRVVGPKGCVKVDVVKGGVRKRVFDCTKVFILPKQTKPFVLRTLIDKWRAANHITVTHITVSNSEYQPRMVTNDMKGLHVTFVNELAGTICGEVPGADAIVISKNTGGGTFKLINHGWIFGAGGNGGKGGRGGTGAPKTITYTYYRNVQVTVPVHTMVDSPAHLDFSKSIPRYAIGLKVHGPGKVTSSTGPYSGLPTASDPLRGGTGYTNLFAGHVIVKLSKLSANTVGFRATLNIPHISTNTLPAHLNLPKKPGHTYTGSLTNSVPNTPPSAIAKINLPSKFFTVAAGGQVYSTTIHFSYAGGTVNASFYLNAKPGAHGAIRLNDTVQHVVYSYSGQTLVDITDTYRIRETWMEHHDVVKNVTKTISKPMTGTTTIPGGGGGQGGQGGAGAHYKFSAATDGHTGTSGMAGHAQGKYGNPGGKGGKGGKGGAWGKAGLKGTTGDRGGGKGTLGLHGANGGAAGAAIRGAKNMTSDSNPGTATGKPTVAAAYGGYRGLVIK